MTEEEKIINDLDPCPDENYLKDYASGKLNEKRAERILQGHLQFCANCSRKVEGFRSGESLEDSLSSHAERLRQRAAEVRRGLQEGPRPGSLWRAVPGLAVGEDPCAPLLIVLGTDSGPDGRYVRVAEVSEDIEQAIHTDLLLNDEESGLSIPCMVRSENTFETGYESLERWVGQLSPMLVRRVLWFCGSPGSLDEKVPLSEYVFLKDSKGTTFMQRRKVTSGMLVTSDEDPRLEFLESSKDRCSYLHFLRFGKASGMDDFFALIGDEPDNDELSEQAEESTDLQTSDVDPDIELSFEDLDKEDT